MSGTPALAAGADAVAQQAIADLSRRTGVPASEIKVVSVEPVTWPDASLGCPKPGMMYAQVLTEGYRVRLEANGKVYEYHSGGNSAPSLCENPAG